MRLWMFLLLCGFTFCVNSTELTPAERMLNAMGINKILDQTKEAQSKSAQDQVEMIMRQLSGTLSKLPDEKVKEIEVLFQNMMIEISDSWSTEEAIKIYSQAWTDNFTEKEILEHFSTSHLVSYVSKLTFNQTGEIIRQANVLLCCDGGLMHAANALDTRIIPLFARSIAG